MERHLIRTVESVVIPPSAIRQPRAHEHIVTIHDHPDDRVLRAAVFPDRLDVHFGLAIKEIERLPVE
jgi:hypothetical protein